MADWQVGDLAVCVDAEGQKWGSTPLVRGHVYRVLWVGKSQQGPIALQVMQSDFEQNGCWESTRFRKIEPAEPCFSEAMRNLKPRVEA